MTQTELKELLHYNPETGVFTWKIRVAHSRIKVGNIAGCVNPRGYVVIRIRKTLYKAHRLAWLYENGTLPTKQLDHKNGDKSDNRINNLRLATNTQNGMNRQHQVNNEAGVKGVSWNCRQNKWHAYIRVNGKQIYLGYFDNKENATKAYNRAATRYFKEFAKLNPV